MSADNARAEALADFIATERDKYPRRADDMDSEELAQKIIEWLASRKPEAAPATPVSDTDEPQRCLLCGRVANECRTGDDITQCSQPVQVEVTDDMIARAEREYQWSGNIRKVLVAALGGGE